MYEDGPKCPLLLSSLNQNLLEFCGNQTFIFAVKNITQTKDKFQLYFEIIDFNAEKSCYCDHTITSVTDSLGNAVVVTPEEFAK